MIRVQGLHKSYVGHENARVDALKELHFELKPGEFYSLLGPSGCGKSTTLRCIAGFEEPQGGEIWIGDQLVYSSSRGVNMPAHLRAYGIVFQSYAIWPHMTVFDNVAFPLVHGKRKVPRAEVKPRVMRALESVQMQSMADRPAPLLSGGQQQRVALARALVNEPAVLLLDEPLSNLDAKLREEVRLQIRDLTKRLNITTLYVTHDQLEALSMSDRVAVMQAGQIMQEGSPIELYQTPNSRFVAEFIGSANFVDGVVATLNGPGRGVLDTPVGSLHCQLPEGAAVGTRATLVVRPEQVRVVQASAAPESNVIEGQVDKAVFTGETLEAWVAVPGQLLQAKVDPFTPIQAGERILLHLPPERCRAIVAPTAEHQPVLEAQVAAAEQPVGLSRAVAEA